MATYMGRPPTLNRAYFKCELPLDVSDEQLTLDYVGAMPNAGWSTNGMIYPATTLRACMLGNMKRDQILEYCLGSQSQKSLQEWKYVGGSTVPFTQAD